MQTPSFEYCSMRFLIQWVRRERHLHENLSNSPTIDGIREALRYFKVARTFKGLGDDEKADKVVKGLIAVSNELTKKNVIKQVQTLAGTFKKEFESKNLSAASKLLWLRCRTPVIIFDKRAKIALANLCPEYKKQELANYNEYYECWHYIFKSHQKKIKRSISGLINIKKYTPLCYESDKSFKDCVNNDWFIERTFDIYLWEIGGLEPKST